MRLGKLAVLLLLGIVTLGADQAAPTGTAIVAGRLEERTSGEPVGNALITLMLSGPAGPRQPGDPPPRQSQAYRVLTNTDGRFVFHSLPGGQYSLSAARSGYLTHSVGVLQVPASGRIPDVIVRIQKYASLSGTIRDEAGEPAVGANVQLLFRTFERGEPRFRYMYRATTDDRGIYRFGEIGPGSYLVVVPMMIAAVPTETAVAYLDAMAGGAAVGNQVSTDVRSSGGSLSAHGVRVADLLVQRGLGVGVNPPLVLADDGSVHVYPTTFHPSTGSTSAATVITLASGEARTGVDIAVRPVPTVRVSGVVTGPTGPAANLTVKFAPSTLGGLLASASFDGSVVQTITRRDGSFTAVGVPAGEYLASIVRSAGVVSTDTAAPGSVLWGRAKLLVAGVDVHDVAIRLSPGITVAGRVEFEAGAIPPPSAEVLQRARVQIRPVEQAAAPRPVAVQVGADGTFQSSQLAPGPYTVAVTLAAPGWSLRSITASGRNVLDANLELDGDISGMSVVFTDRMGEVAGSIAGLAPGEAAYVVLISLDPRAPSGIHAGRARQVVARTASFRFTSVLPGDYAAVAFGATPETGSAVETLSAEALSALAKQGTRVTVGEREAKTVALTLVDRR